MPGRELKTHITGAEIPNDLIMPDQATVAEVLIKLVFSLVHRRRTAQLSERWGELALDAVRHREGCVVDDACRLAIQSSEDVPEGIVPEFLNVRSERIVLLSGEQCVSLLRHLRRPSRCGEADVVPDDLRINSRSPNKPFEIHWVV
jgi:hypothetical protein